MMREKDGSLPSAAALLAGLGLLVQGCSSGSGPSDVGKRTDIAPTARVQALNGGETNTYREGSEVLISGKDSEDGDGPVLKWSWAQTAGPAVELIERNKTTVGFTAPPVSDDTTLSFELSVADADGLTGTASLDVTVTPARDPDKFLSLDVRGATRNTFDRFQVVPALAEGASTDSTPKPFTLSARAYLIYPPRSAPNVDCTFDAAEFAAGIPVQTATGCLVALLEDLTPASLPGGGTGIAGEWPANVPTVVRPSGLTADQLEAEWWNPHYTLKVPRLDVADFNQPFVDSGDRSRMLDTFNTPKARIVLSFELTAPENQQDATLIVNDIESAPITLPASASPKHVRLQSKIVDNSGAGLPTTAVLPLEQVLAGIVGRESGLTAELYYRTVDPDSTRTTLNDWLEQAGFASDGEGTLLPEAESGAAEFAHAIYLNNYDLGFGRDMYTRTDEYGNVFAFVGNYSTLEGAIRKSTSIATVVMEYSPLNGAADPTEKFVKFFTYIDDGSGDSRRVASMNFDGRGEIATPGNCVACHGGADPPGVSELLFDDVCGDTLDAACYAWPDTNRDGVDISNGNLHSTFLPWDANALLFADTDPAITGAPVRFDGLSLGDRLKRDYGDYSRGAQEAEIKKLNQAAYATYCDAAVVADCPTDAARRLVEHWYGGVDQDGALVSSTFDDSAAIEGWKNGETVAVPTLSDPGATAVNPDTAEGLYHDVFAQHCRMCHINITEESLRFDNYQKLAAVKDLLAVAVFQRGTMPAARLTADRFWAAFGDGTASTAERLAQEFDIQPVGDRLGPSPMAEVTGAGGTFGRNEVVRLSGINSSFAHAFDWGVEYQPSEELLGNPDVASFQPTLIGQSGPELSFAAGKPGTYTVSLTVEDAFGASSTADPIDVNVPNFAPQPVDIDIVVPEGESATLSVMDQLDLLCTSPGCPEVFGDAPYSVSVDVSGWDANDGTVTLDDPATGTITVSATQPASSGAINASIPFTVTDADLESAVAAVNVTIQALSEPVAQDDSRSMSAQTTLDPPGTRTLSIAVLDNDSGDPSALPLHIDSFTQPANGSVTQSGNNLVYQPDLGFIGSDTFLYSNIDSNPTGGRSSANATVSVSVTVTSTFGTDVQGAFSNKGCLGAGCHDGVSAPDWTDYNTVTGSSRVNDPADARNSLILAYPTTTTHTGGNLWAEGDADYDAVLRWIEEGHLEN